MKEKTKLGLSTISIIAAAGVGLIAINSDYNIKMEWETGKTKARIDLLLNGQINPKKSTLSRKHDRNCVDYWGAQIHDL